GADEQNPARPGREETAGDPEPVHEPAAGGVEVHRGALRAECVLDHRRGRGGGCEAERRGAPADVALTDPCALGDPCVGGVERLGQLVVGDDPIGERGSPADQSKATHGPPPRVQVTRRAYVQGSGEPGYRSGALMTASVHRDTQIVLPSSSVRSMFQTWIRRPACTGVATAVRTPSRIERTWLALSSMPTTVWPGGEANDPPMLAADSASSAETPPWRTPVGWWTFGPTWSRISTRSALASTTSTSRREWI